MLDARGALSVSERVGYILKVRTIAKTVAEEYLKMTEGINLESSSGAKND
ncbi:MAG: glycine--tRNA ligase subunit alpha [Cytophagales bacterium]|nr:glycine--tRNA ligase subunit alpha [Cytophagales bacterium]